VFPVSLGMTVHPPKQRVYTGAWAKSTWRFTAPRKAAHVLQAGPVRSRALLGIATAALVVATTSSAPAAAPRPLPTAGETPLLGGDYATSRFIRPFSFSVRERDDWRVEHVAREEITLMRGSACCGQNAGARTGVLMVLRPSRVVDPRTGKPTRVPANVARWIRTNPHVRTGRASRLRVDGMRALVFSIGFRSATPRSEGCAGFLQLSFGRFGLCPGERARLAVLDVGARPLLIQWSSATARAIARLERPVRRLLATVRFGKRRVAARPRVLVIGNSDPTTDDELFFAREAARLSGGTLQISLKSQLYGERPDRERRVARDLQAGRLPLAWDATRVWDTEGVTTFQGLQAPFLIDSVGLMDRVIASPLAAQVASGLGAQGVTGLGLAAINLRRPLGARKPFTSVAAFQGAKVNVITSRLSEDILRALGATPVDVGGGEVLGAALRSRKVDAAETAIDVVFRNGYAEVAKYMSSNVVLFPKFASIDANAAMLAALPAAQRDALARAAAATGPYSTARLKALEAADAAALCKQGIRFASATQAELDALLVAEKPVYDALAADPVSASIIDGVRALKQQGDLGSGLTVPAGCRT
jgi:TRAP-type C4-dicarboxylate transport system substrate-binding protein